MADETNIVDFKASAAPSARVKTWQDVGEKRAMCRHTHVEVYSNEPILECKDCGGIVDPYVWIRKRCSDWKQMEDAVQCRISMAKAEYEDLKKAVRHLRGEWKDEVEKNRAERRSLMIRPPQKSF